MDAPGYLPTAAVAPEAAAGLQAALATEALAARARAERAMLAYPDRDWITPRTAAGGDTLADVLIVGGGQSGLGIAAALQAQGLRRVVVLDAQPAGQEGPWRRYARMPELRTPKALNGLDLGQPSLSLQAWFAARHGEAAWAAVERVSREDWADYLDWYRDTLALPVENGVQVGDVRPEGDGLSVATREADGRPGLRFARQVVLATGLEGAGAWRVPAVLAQALPAARCHHACMPIDPAVLRGARVAVLGHGASAFDQAVQALNAGARSVDLCCRRPRLPRTNPHRQIETAGLMAHYPALSATTRWRIARHFRLHDQPPPVTSFRRALADPRFRLHAGRPWTAAHWDGRRITLETPTGPLHADQVIAATGLVTDLSARPEWHTLQHHVRRWSDEPLPMPAGHAPDAIDAALGAYPVLGEHYECQPRRPGADDWVRRVWAFNGASYVSQGPHSTSISGHKHALPRLVRGLLRQLLLDEEAQLLPALEAYAARDLDVPDDFETRQAARAATCEVMP